MAHVVRRALTALLAAGLLAGPLAGTAAAVEPVVPGGATIGLVQPGPEGLRILVSVPAGTEVDLDDVAVTVGGVATTATAEPAGDAPADVVRTTVLAIDTSDSMAGERFDAARTAATTFLDEVPDDVRVGVVTFAGEVVEALPPTTDRDAARDVVDGLALSRGTRLYEGVLAALDLAGEEGQRNVLVLSDGADTSRTPLTDVTASLRRAGAVVDVVALEQDADATGPLEALATAGDGRVVGADAEALRATFAAQADALARQVLVTAPLPPGVTSAEATVAVVLGSSTGDVVAEVYAEVQGAAVAVPTVPRASSGGATVPEPVMYVGVAALGVALLLVGYLLVPRAAAAPGAEDRVSAYTRATGAGAGGAGGDAGPSFDKDAALAQATGAAASVLERNRSLEARIAKRLEGAGSRLKPAEWLLMEVGVVVAAGLVGLLLGGGNAGVALLLGLVGAAVPWVLLGVQRNRRLKAFNAALPDTLSLMSGSLAAGLSLAQSVDTIVREGQEPIASEFKRVLVETRLGVSLEDALEGITDRFDSKDFAWVVMAIRIQRQVGGNLGELLNTVAATMREREYLRRQVATLSAEGRLSAYVLGGLPPFFLLYLVLTQRDYVMPLFTEPLGWLMLIGAGTLLAVGMLWMSRIVKVDV